MKIMELSLGSFLLFGRYQKAEILWRKVAQPNVFLDTCGFSSLMVDAPEPESTREAIRNRGSNFFPQTNICTWLNSERKDWYIPQHDKDAVEDSMKADYSGFLHEFEPWEKEIILPQEITTVVPGGYRRRFGSQTKTTVKVSIPSSSQLYQRDDESEGALFEWYRDRDHWRRNMVTRTAVGTGVLVTGHKGMFCNMPPCSKGGIYPCVLIDQLSEVDYWIDESAYILCPPQSYIKETIDELHQILK